MKWPCLPDALRAEGRGIMAPHPTRLAPPLGVARGQSLRRTGSVDP
jgi:hypothetical protein